MPPYEEEPENDVKISVCCAKHGKYLGIDKTLRPERLAHIIIVNPCYQCSLDNYNQGFNSGYNAGVTDSSPERRATMYNDPDPNKPREDDEDEELDDEELEEESEEEDSDDGDNDPDSNA